MTPESLSLTLTSFAPALKNHLWQSTLFLLAAALLTLVLRRNHARTRYWLWLAASIKFLVPFSLLITLGSHFATPRPVPPTQTTVYFAMEEVSQPFAPIVIPITAPAPVEKHRAPLLPIVLAAVWFAGFAVVLAIWFVYWRRITAILRASTLITQGRELEILRRLESTFATPYSLFPIPSRIQLLASPSTLGPGIYGLTRPILLWPAAISQRLDDAHLESIFAHEICHVRRRDNLTAALHMLVEAIFWFHPLVWALGARLEAERERACDESVLEDSPALTTRPHIYAESIVKICEFYVESPLPCVSGVTGADLKKRLTDILERHATLKLSLGKKLLLAAMALVAVTVPVLSGQAKAMQRLTTLIDTAPRRITPSLLAALISPAEAEQTADAKIETQDAVAQDTPKPAFEVASIRPSAPDPTMMRYQPTPNGMIIDAMTLKSLIANIYNVRAGSIYGGPEWVSSQQFDINTRIGDKDLEALTRLPAKARGQQYNLMLQQLLESRFKLKVRRETREMPIYALVVTKGGAKLTASPPLTPAADGTMPPEGGGETEMFDGRHIVKRYDMKTFAMQLGGWPDVGREVIDQTGLKGRYDFEWKWKSSPDDSGPSIFSALQEQLGLKLESRKGPVETLVIESVEKPSQDGAESVAPTPATLKPIAFVQEKTAPAPSVAAPYVPTLTFDVATIRETKPDVNAGFMVSFNDPDHNSTFHFTNVQAWQLITAAYGIKDFQLSGEPDWLKSSTLYEVNAKSDDIADEKLAKLTTAQGRLEKEHMLQVLLADRLKLQVHWETREGNVYNLVATRGGPKLRTTGAPPSADEIKWWGDHPVPPLYQHGDSRKEFDYIAHACQMSDLVEMLTVQFGRPVVDKTGLAGKYDFVLKTHDTRNSERRDNDTNPLPTLETAIQDQLGLKLESAKGPIQVLVIDHIEKPSEN